jgi:hypothetical protein
MAYNTFIPTVTEGIILSLDAYNIKSYVDGNTTAYDLTKNAYNGTLTNGVSFNENTWVFDGVNDYIDLSAFVDSLIFNSPVTIDFWFKPNNNKTTAGIMFSIGNGFAISGTDSFSISYGNFTGGADGETVSIVGGANGLDQQAKITMFGADVNTSIEYQDTWTHVCVVVDSGTWTMYINGEEKSLTRLTGTANNYWYGENISPKNYVYIGARSLGSPITNFNGSISNFKLYNRGLSSSEAKQNYKATKWRFK